MEEKSLEHLLMQPLHRVVQPEDPPVQAVRLMDLIGDIVGDGVQPQEVVMAMVLVLVRHQKEVDSGLVQVRGQELDLGLVPEEEEPQTVVLAMEVGPGTQVKVVAQAMEMVEDHQVGERGANTANMSVLVILP
ncbi:PREDICTED: uncharacterized protein LOC104718494 [Camelina sativa]|uniref:Uncharacterized protein LOC104718493 n=1 Tax=Camelina sativa TaxID=90675 RepID=A0ABM1QI29_CAMSA|nr:PREDICTED: uncharacterized protein LOC104718495 [Camelina sativa]XP_019086418.1 PREDICTED: uncharacterized protein LOC104718493 [Camelina sativa]XP_019086419.1 PREDICTED: uncharacterized protein LOC104718494 [Camelina sativa]